MAIRLTESKLRQIIREEARRLRRRRLSEAMRGPITDIDAAVAAIQTGGPAGQDAACLYLAEMFEGSPTPGMDIAMSLQDAGLDEDTAFDIAESTEMKYMDIETSL